MKKIKTLYLSIFVFLSFFFYLVSVNAASMSLNESLSTSSTVVGNTITVTVRISSSSPLGYVNYSMSYDSSKLTLTSGTQNNALYSFTGVEKSTTVTFKFKAKASGSANVSLNINEALDFDGNALSGSKSVSRTITIKTQAQIEASYSSNNNLSKLSISAGTLSPQFKKDVTTYTAEVPNEVTSINVTGSKEDSKSYVDGFKSYNLEEGTNKINVKVTAQNGNAKTYTINVTRKELAPIIASINGIDFNVVRKSNLLEKPNTNYKETTIKIGNEEVPAFVNDVTNTTLVGLKDDKGNISLYKYENEKYIPYKEYSFDSIIVTPSKDENIPAGYEKTTIKIGEDELVAYKEKDGSNDYYLFNATNINTGKDNLYRYDKKENTIQIYYDNFSSKIDNLEKTNKNYGYVIIGLGLLLIITYVVILISSLKRNKKIKKLERALKEKAIKEKELEEKVLEEQKKNENSIKIEKVDKEIEKKRKKDDKIKEDISSKEKKEMK